MKVLFISSGNSKNNNINILVERQADSIKEKDVSVENFYITRKGISGYLKSVFQVRKYLNNSKFDILHAHYGWSGLVTLLTLKPVKKIISFMGDDLIGSVNEYNKYTLTSKFISKLNIFLAKCCYDYNIVKSENLKYNLKGIDNTSLIPNGVDMNIFFKVDKIEAKKSLGLSDEKKYILFVSDPERKEKNFALAESSVKLLESKNLELCVLTNVRSDKLNIYYNSADCLLLTSVHEGSPNVVKEAMACGCPIVSTDVGDVKWIYGNTDGCYLTSFEPDDVAAKINMALNFSEKYGRTKGRERIIELGLDSDTIAEKIIEVYKKVLMI